MRTIVKPWSAKDVDTAIRLYSEGHTFSNIAQTLRRSRGEIAGKLFRLRREGKVDSRLGKDRPPPREPKNPKPSPKPTLVKPRPPQPIRRIKVSPDHRPHPPQYIPPPRPAGPPTCWELGPYDCRFPIGRREPEGHSTFCARPVEPGTSWCPGHHAVVYARRSA